MALCPADLISMCRLRMQHAPPILSCSWSIGPSGPPPPHHPSSQSRGCFSTDDVNNLKDSENPSAGCSDCHSDTSEQKTLEAKSYRAKSSGEGFGFHNIGVKERLEFLSAGQAETPPARQQPSGRSPHPPMPL